MKKYRNWWTNRWFSIIKGKRLERRYEEGKKLYQRNKDDYNIFYSPEENKLSGRTWDFREFYATECEIGFPKFSENEKKFIIELITESPTFLFSILENKLSKEFCKKIENENIELFPYSIKDLYINCDCGVNYCKHAMRIFHFFGLELDKYPLLLLGIKGLDLSAILKQYANIAINHVKTIEKEFKKIAIENNEEKTISNEDKIKALENIDFSYIPKLKKTIDLFLDEKPDFFKRDFKPIFLRNLNYQSKNKEFTKGNKLKLNFKPFTSQRENESDSEFKKRVFLMKWDEPKYLKPLKISLNIFNQIEEISIFSGDTNLKYILHEFFFEMDEELIKQYDYSIQYGYKLYQFSEVLIKQVAIIPEILFDSKSEKQHIVRWIPAFFNEEINHIVQELIKIFPNDLVIFDGDTISKLEQIKIITSIFIGNFIEGNVPKSLINIQFEKPFKLLFSNQNTQILEYEANSINNWLWRLFLFESERKIDLKVELENDKFTINLVAGLETVKEKLKTLNAKDKLKLLYDVSLLDKYYPEINKTINNNEKTSYNVEEFTNFYFEKIPLLKSLNFKVELPDTIKTITTPEIVGDFNSEKEININKRGLLNLEALIDFDWKIAIGNEKISVNDFKKLVSKSKSFIKFKNNYYFLDDKKTKKLSKDIEDLPEKMRNNEILQAILSSKYGEAIVNVDENISNSVKNISQINDLKVPSNLNGVLREYQIRGFSWLVQNTLTGFGSILADDMGLGKTLEVLTAILHFKNQGMINKKKVLVIAPTAILFNWENEIKKFTPDLSSEIYHTNNRKINPKIDITITSFGMIRSDFKEFKRFKWFLIVVDEAQNIKNPNTQQTKFIKKLESLNKIALTGTPIENRLMDYWSIFDFTNENYLYNKRKFKKLFESPIEKENDVEVLEKFKKISAPFILRRMKTDKKVINDLPEKISDDCYCFLSKNQTVMYQRVIDDILEKIKKSEGIKRKGLVLKLINSLKQICNHPSQYSKSKDFTVEESGKMEMLMDILGNTEENREKVVIFTQFVQMGNIIAELVEDKFNIDVLFYHGGLTRKNRDKIINDFQNKSEYRVMIVSLKAGGSGLNLSSATHVIHFDLWWNPAVENQATDRVHRIGQKNNIFVHRFITKGTFEERINQMLVEKNNLAELTIGSGEKFITEMDNEELRTLLDLSTMDI